MAQGADTPQSIQSGHQTHHPRGFKQTRTAGAGVHGLIVFASRVVDDEQEPEHVPDTVMYRRLCVTVASLGAGLQ